MTYALYLLATIGLAAAMVDVPHGPGAWAMRVIVRPLLSSLIGLAPATNLVTCMVCFSAYCGLVVGGVVALATMDVVPLFTLPLAAPGAIWMFMRLIGALGGRQ